MNKHHPSMFWNLLAAISLAASLLFSEQGGVIKVEASSDSAEMTASANQAASSLETVTYNDTDKAWTYSGKWTTSRFRNAYRGEAHISTATGDYATISISGSNFTLLYGVHKKYGKLDVFIDDVKIQTIDQNNPRQLQKKEWKSPELGAGTHLVKFVHASGEMVSIDAVKVTASTTVSAPSSDSVSSASPTPTSAATLESNPTVPPTLTEVPTLAVIPSATASIPPTEIPTLTLLPSPTASPIPLSLPTLLPSPSPSSVPTIQPATPTASPAPSQLPPPSASPTLTATSLSVQSATSVSGTIYYVAGSGSDSNPGTQALPWKTIQKCLNTVKAGDTCLVAAGTYNEALVLKTSGTASNSITLKASGSVIVNSGASRTLITNGRIHYYIIDGFSFIANYTPTDQLNAALDFTNGIWDGEVTRDGGNNGFIVRNCYVEGAIRFYGHNNLVENCEFNGKGLWHNGITDRFPVSHDNVYRNNTVHDYKVRGIWTNHGTNNILIERNTIYRNGSGGIDCDGAFVPVTGCNIRGNVIYSHTNGEGYGVLLENTFDSIVEGNRIYNGVRGISQINYGLSGSFIASAEFRTTNTNVIIRNNLIYNMSSDGILCKGAPGGKALNNTIYNTLQSPGYWAAIGLAQQAGYYCHNWEIKNNIISQSQKAAVWYESSSSGLTNLSMDYNLFDLGSNEAKFVWVTRATTGDIWKQYTLAQLQSQKQLELHSVLGNPLFVNPATGDFHLQATSPAINSGFNPGNLNPRDFDGNPRPLGTNFDIGAFEQASN